MANSAFSVGGSASGVPANYIGQTTITTLGTITTGVWHGTPITVPYGGTGATLFTPAYGVICAGTTTTGALQCAGVGLAGEILTSNGAGALPTFQAAAAVTGRIVQVVSATFTATAASASSTFADTGITVSITPSLNTSKILVTAMVNVGSNDIPNNAVYLNLVRDVTNILVGDAASARIRVTAFPGSGSVVNNACSTLVYLDSPATVAATTYKVQFAASNNAGTVYINRSTQDNDLVSLGRGASTITVMEVSA